MKVKIIIGIIIVFMAVATLPLALINDARNLSAKEIACSKLDTEMMLSNPIERFLILKIAVDKKEDNTFFTSAYTIAGIKYATVELVCYEHSTITWRRWF